jgi:hypothetical protein
MIFCIPHIIAQFIVHRTFCSISCINPIVLFPFILRIWLEANWYHDLGRVDTMTRGELITWLWANWYHDLGWVDTMTRGELITWPGASSRELIPHVLRFRISKPYDYWSARVTPLLIITTVKGNLLSPCQSFVYDFTSWIVIRNVQPPVNTRHRVALSVTLVKSLSQHVLPHNFHTILLNPVHNITHNWTNSPHLNEKFPVFGKCGTAWFAIF